MASDPNGDGLLFDVEYRAAGATQFQSIRTELTDPVFVWDTTAIPDGRYVVRITATDSPGNPESLVLRGSMDSHGVVVDNTAPRLTAATLGRRRVRVLAHDESSVIRRMEYAVDGSDWLEVPGRADVRERAELFRST